MISLDNLRQVKTTVSGLGLLQTLEEWLVISNSGGSRSMAQASLE
jgi:hypothetical protein